MTKILQKKNNVPSARRLLVCKGMGEGKEMERSNKINVFLTTVLRVLMKMESIK